MGRSPGSDVVKTYVGVFAVSAIFGLVVAVVYWFTAHREAAGTALLGIVGAAMAFAAIAAMLAERDADLEADDPNANAGAEAGEDLGVFTTQSAWPPLVAVSALALLLGVLWSPLVAACALVALVLCLWRLGAESART